MPSTSLYHRAAVGTSVAVRVTVARPRSTGDPLVGRGASCTPARGRCSVWKCSSLEHFPWQPEGMRADRLVAALLLLPARGRGTAAQLAGEPEVSVATARRDLDALSSAGLPV